MPVTALTILAPAPPHTLFHPGAFEGHEGDRVALTLDGGVVVEATVVECVVFDRGRAVTITLGYDDE